MSDSCCIITFVDFRHSTPSSDKMNSDMVAAGLRRQSGCSEQNSAVLLPQLKRTQTKGRGTGERRRGTREINKTETEA